MSASSTALRLRRPPVTGFSPRVRAPHLGLMVVSAARDLRAAIQQTGAASWALEINTRPHRTQVVHVEHDRIADRVVIRSVVGPFRPNLGSGELMRRNGSSVLGAIGIEDLPGPNGLRPYLTVRHVQARTKEASDLRTAIAMVGWTADELERDLFARDIE
jgi:hypothetical protein